MREDAGERSGTREGLSPGTLTRFLRDLAAAPARAAEPRPPLPPGALVGRFEILRELGRGGFGVVYEARDRDLGRLVALKLVRPGQAAAGGGRVSREAEVIARLAHPNLVTLFDVGVHEGEPYLIFERLHGRTLHERLEAGPLGVAEAVHLAVEVARGVAHAHGEGVVHRDLKPSNVFLTDQGPVKILDFGLAHVFGRRRLSGGTPAYMAPEQWADEPEDERTDVFALGVLLYRMLSGHLPFGPGDGRWSAEAAGARRLDVPAAPELGPLLERMLERPPGARPRDGAAVLAEFLAVEARLRSSPAGATAEAPVTRRRAAPGELVARLRRRHVVRAAVPLIAAGLLAALVAAGWALWRTLRAPPAARPSSIAVLPFADLSPGHDQGYVSEGVADEIRSGLAQLGGLRIIGRTTSSTYRGGQKRVEEIGRELGVEHVLEGSLRTAGTRTRLLAQLVRATDGSILWTRTYERETGDLFAVQDEISRAVVESLRLSLAAGGAGTRRGGTGNAEALRQHLLGRDLLRSGSPGDAGRALQAHDRAIALDPGFAQAWAGRAFALHVVENLSGEGSSPGGRRRILESADRAIALAPSLADGYAVRGNARLGLEYDWAGARTDLHQAVALEPGNPEARTALGNALVVAGEFAAGLAELERATDLDPLSAVAWHVLGLGRLYAGDHAGALEALRRALALGPDDVLARLALVEALLAAGRPAEALAAARADEVAVIRHFGVAAASHQLGDAGAARAALDQLTRDHALEAAFQIAQVMAWTGDLDQAFAWLDRARAQLDSGIPGVMVDPMLRGLRADPRYPALLARLGLEPARRPPGGAAP